MIEVSIVVPVYNSHDCLRELSHQVDLSVDVPYELILVDDFSSDTSWTVIQELAEADERIRGVRLRKNSGQDNALMAGLNLVRGKYAVIMDDDLQHDPADIRRMLEKCREGYDVVFARFDRKRQRAWKNVGSFLNEKASEFFLNKPPGVYLSPFKMIESGVVKEVCRYDGPFPYVDGLILTVTHNFAEIDAFHRDRHAGASTYTFLRSLSVFAKHITGFSVIPLRIVAVFGLVSALLGILLASFYVGLFLVGGESPEGWYTIVCLLLLIGGGMMASIGLVGEYIGRTYLRVNLSPQYTIRSLTWKPATKDDPESASR